jgi:ABC-type antimicrobial peptide transport system permease subunit
MTIVGVVGDVQQYAFDRPATMQAYKPQAQDISFGYTMMVRASATPQQFESAIRSVFHSIDKTQPVQAILPLEDYLSASLSQRRFTLTLLGAFGALALLMAGVGTYGVISYAVSLRTRELGIRMALGAQARDVLAMVLRQGLSLAAAGLAAGFLASLALTRVLSSMLYEVQPNDVASVTVVALLLVAVAFLACYVPARRATKVDPMVALRYE